jgi:protein-L-isoaspartate(D-aspartate) O-methyltransferase
MELKAARFNMIEQQIRPWDVLDQGVLDLIAELPREDFVPEAYRSLAYADTAIPLGHGQVMMHPKIEARLLQALDLHATDTVLEIGTGSAYLTALLARATHHVYSVDIIPQFKQQAAEKLAVQGIDNVTLEAGDAARGWPKHGLYDVIAITGSLPELPAAFLQSMNRGGRLFAVLGTAPIMEAMLIRRVGDSEWSRESLFETELPRLINAPATARFVF